MIMMLLEVWHSWQIFTWMMRSPARIGPMHLLRVLQVLAIGGWSFDGA